MCCCILQVLDKQNRKQRENGHSKGAVQLTKTTSEKHFVEKTFTAMPDESVNILHLLPVISY